MTLYDRHRLAMHWQPMQSGRVECTLCPRHCKPKSGAIGYCGVRGNLEGEMRAYNYGKALAATEEVIETEAINHYRPGARILSMGNIGCMMSCSFCQNWETSQVKHLDQRVIRKYTPQQIVELCLANDIDVLSWTYNDPVVWHEFVLETSAIAQAQGIRTLYKSAFYIERTPVDELIDCIDIFSLSLKSLSERFYQKITRAKLAPVLDRIKQVYRSGRHLEISQLVIPELNDQDEDVHRSVEWITSNLGTQVPIHFVAFHPAYRYTHVDRTSLATLKKARNIAYAAGIEHVYLGNTYQAELNDTRCSCCGSTLVRRYGLHAEVQNLDHAGNCTQCGTDSPIHEPFGGGESSRNKPVSDLSRKVVLRWNDEIQSAHVLRERGVNSTDQLRVRPLGPYSSYERRLRAGLDRFIVSRKGPEDLGVVISWSSNCDYQLIPVLDRAHFPVAEKAIISAQALAKEIA